MDIFIPIAVGFLLNTVIYLSLLFFTRKRGIATICTLASFIVLLASSFVIGSWLGMGLAVVSGGMLLAYILFLVIGVFIKGKIYFSEDHTTEPIS